MSPLRRRVVIGVATGAMVSGAFAQTVTTGDGEAAFGQCAACHSLDGSAGTGPTLQGIAGRKAGTVAGFRYSRALRNAGSVWDAAALDGFVSDPQHAVPGNVMPYSGMTDARQRAALIDYLSTRPSTGRP